MKRRKEILIYDRDCVFCRSTASFLSKFGVFAVPIQDVYYVLEGFFSKNRVPFALYLIDEEGIWWGDYAIFKFLKNRKLGPFSYLSFLIYPVLKRLNRNAERINNQMGICGCMLSGYKKLPEEKLKETFEKLLKII
jgi:predicted DCC family thiol-disulfide oxidoreductase YuxK